MALRPGIWMWQLSQLEERLSAPHLPNRGNRFPPTALSRATSVITSAPRRRSIRPLRASALSSRVTASRCVLIRLAISAWVGTGVIVAVLPLGLPVMRKAQQLGMNPVPHRQHVELHNAIRQSADQADEILHHVGGNAGVVMQKLSRNFSAGNAASTVSLSATNGCRARQTIDRGEFAKAGSGRKICKGNFLSGGRIDGHAHLAGNDEIDVACLVFMAENELVGCEPVPSARRGDQVSIAIRKAVEQLDTGK